MNISKEAAQAAHIVGRALKAIRLRSSGVKTEGDKIVILQEELLNAIDAAVEADRRSLNPVLCERIDKLRELLEREQVKVRELAKEIRGMQAALETEARRTCSQCGQSFESPACGPTHAAIWAERHQPSASLELEQEADTMTGERRPSAKPAYADYGNPEGQFTQPSAIDAANEMARLQMIRGSDVLDAAAIIRSHQQPSTTAPSATREWCASLDYGEAPEQPSAPTPERPCTCHPDDNPPVPCAEQYALSECKAAATTPDVEKIALRLCENLGYPRDSMAYVNIVETIAQVREPLVKAIEEVLPILANVGAIDAYEKLKSFTGEIRRDFPTGHGLDLGLSSQPVGYRPEVGNINRERV